MPPFRSNTTSRGTPSPSTGRIDTSSPVVSPPSRSNNRSQPRLTDFYDSYVDSYSDPNPPAPFRSAGAVGPGAWTFNNANPNHTLSRSSSRSNLTSNYTSSGRLRRKGTRRPAPRGAGTQSGYEEEEGYASGEYDDPPLVFAKVRVKLHYQGDIRGMAFAPDTSFEEFMERLTSKFGKTITGLSLKFLDEDGGKVTLKDESDYDLAIETAREGSKGKAEGKLEIWCVDV